jgi:hypothetical protein
LSLSPESEATFISVERRLEQVLKHLDEKKAKRLGDVTSEDDVRPPGIDALKLFSEVIYCHSMVILSFLVVKLLDT